VNAVGAPGYGWDDEESPFDHSRVDDFTGGEDDFELEEGYTYSAGVDDAERAVPQIVAYLASAVTLADLEELDRLGVVSSYAADRTQSGPRPGPYLRPRA
jgi:hypothetical protein